MVEFAPLFVPWERRLQTLATVQWVFSAFFLPPAALLSPDLHRNLRRTPVHKILVHQYPVYILVVPGTRQATPGGQAFRFHKALAHVEVHEGLLSRLECLHGKSAVRPETARSPTPLLSLQLVKTAELDPSRNYLAGFHPHGILATGAFTNLCTESTGFSSLFPGIRPNLMTLNLLFRVPFFRDYVMSLGLVSADKESGDHILSRKTGGNLLGIVTGGAQEALNARPGSYKLVLWNRKGFIRLALRHGAALVPVFSFGENDAFDKVENLPGIWLRWCHNVLKEITKITLLRFIFRGIPQHNFVLLPSRGPITTVVGTPIEVQKTPNPSQEEVDGLHQRYLKELSRLFEAHKLKYNVPSDQHLEFC